MRLGGCGHRSDIMGALFVGVIGNRQNERKEGSSSGHTERDGKKVEGWHNQEQLTVRKDASRMRFRH